MRTENKDKITSLLSTLIKLLNSAKNIKDNNNIGSIIQDGMDTLNGIIYEFDNNSEQDSLCIDNIKEAIHLFEELSQYKHYVIRNRKIDNLLVKIKYIKNLVSAY